MGLQYRSRGRKRKEPDGLKIALTMIFAPFAIVGALLFGGVRKRKRRKKW